MEATYAHHPAGGPGSPFDPPVLLRSSRDLLAAVPYLLGFRPRDCCVVVCVTDDGRVGLVARTSLDELAGDGLDARTVARAAGRVATRLALVVLYTDRPRERVRSRADAVVGALDDVLHAVADIEAWIVTPDGYRGLDCDDPSCCPPAGRPGAELEHGEVGAAFVVAGRAIADSEQEAHRIRPAAAAVRDRAAKAASRADRARAAARDATPDVPRDHGMPATGPGTVPVPVGTWRAEAYGVWCDLVRQAAEELRAFPAGEVMLPPARLGRLAAALADVPVRDAVLLSLVPGGREAADRTVGAGARGGADGSADRGAGSASGEVEVATARAISRVVDPRVGVPPDPATADAARLVLEQLVAAAPRRWHAPALALLAFLAWWRGDGWLAARRVRESARRDPSHRLAGLLAGVLEAAVPPGWVSAAGTGAEARVTEPRVG
ncbi:DUF4192 domain-containing protein [Isoptericola sp. 4D.3]|uniref:DUF4192 domain-containing protein n=1 Tax=Isoptericola peretonis TaxID=2918523 RepID=A0ABT0J1G8_9MICO|nr:DUF4192 domain-containing protein [Isoptericola sp. 4D.3]